MNANLDNNNTITEFKKELRALLLKYNASIYHDDSGEGYDRCNDTIEVEFDIVKGWNKPSFVLSESSCVKASDL